MLDEQINSIRIDPGFSAFLDFCEAAGGRVSIVSVGLDRIITGALGNLGRTLPIFANKLEWQGGDRWRLALPWLRCRRCKLQMLTRATVLPGSRYCR
jgi:2-hydroxy-3-keto-5-methylthiopentenyl-1-phosphate phosphatase